MSANFPTASYMPQLVGYTGQGAFRFWCQKVLPIVYDDSLSYYELLNKVVVYLNNVISDVSSCEDNIVILRDAFVELANDVTDRLSDLGIEELVDAKIDQMAADGFFTGIVEQMLGLSGFINLKQFAPNNELTGENFQEAVNNASRYGKSYYVPEGYYYDPHVLVEWDCEFWVDSGAIFEKEAREGTDRANAVTLFRFRDCSVNWSGGTFINGNKADAESDNASTGRKYTDVRGYIAKTGFMTFYNCENCVVSNVKIPYAQLAGCLILRNCRNFTFQNCSFENILSCGIPQPVFNPVRGDGVSFNITVDNCYFKHIKAPTDERIAVGGTTYPITYCYAVYTGVLGNLDATFPTETRQQYAVKPLDNLRYVNNYIDGSDDSGLDTHGASNVYIANNAVLNTVCAITAYNDNEREPRPVGWSMNNIILENNYCESSKKIPSGTNWPHPFIFLGPSAAGYLTGGLGLGREQGYDSYKNCRVLNNVFKTANNFSVSSSYHTRHGKTGWFYLNEGGRNFRIENNYFETLNRVGSIYSVAINRQIAIQFNNNYCNLNQKEYISLNGCYGEAKFNMGFDFYNASQSYRIWYLKGINNTTADEQLGRIANTGDVFWFNSQAYIAAHYGLRWFSPTISGVPDNPPVFQDDNNVEYWFKVEGRYLYAINQNPSSAEYGNHFYVPLIPWLQLTLTNQSTNTTVNATIKNVVSDSVFKFTTSITDGNYTVAIRTATMKSLNNIPD